MQVGSNIGQYRLVRKIGAGGMGTVFVGEHILLGRRAAIKTLLPALSVQQEIVDRFFTEARATSSINDQGVVQVFDFGYHVDGTAYIVMELLEGEALASRLDRLGRLSGSEALRIARQVAGALASAHATGIIHRDLKPENIFLIRDPETTGGERAKLLDFGICKRDGDVALTQTGTMLGTPVYMSPEQCQGARTVDQRSDVYGLGCALYHMLTGQPPFDGEGTGDLVVAHLQQTAPPPSSLVPELPTAVDDLLAKCLAKAPDDRFQSMVALQTAIDQVLPELAALVAPQDAGPSALALGPGFKSNYDGNLGTAVRTRDVEPDWFATPSTLRSLSGEASPLPASSNRSLVAILLAGVLVALIAATFAGMFGASEPAAAAVVEPDAATPDAAIDAAAAETVREPDVGKASDVEPVAPKADEPVAPATAKPRPAAKPPVRRVYRAQPRTPPQQSPPPARPPEDLYEAR